MYTAIIRIGIFVAALSGMVPAAVANMCQPYVGEVVETVDFEKIQNLLQKVPSEKGEFETTAEFEAKVEKFVSTLPKNFLIGYNLHAEPKYDADTQQMLVHERALTGDERYHGIYAYGSLSRDQVENLNHFLQTKMQLFRWRNHREPGYLEKRDIKKEFFDKGALDILVGKTWARTGAYIASNALGASVEVEKFKSKTQVIFERDGDIPTFTENSLALQMHIDAAKRFKQHPKAAVLAAPKPPYFENDNGKVEPTFDKPVEVAEEISVIIADIQCVFVLNGNNEVLGALTVN